jgi:hypothetical protein
VLLTELHSINPLALSTHHVDEHTALPPLLLRRPNLPAGCTLTKSSIISAIRHSISKLNCTKTFQKRLFAFLNAFSPANPRSFC